ncbi:hypothetical protein L6468_10870 [Prevotella communis]|uniref:hypothetical protein n=1 Tax=Prevotella communis TaxID=2913614 RepID=UPI001EDB2196|nr:hypothetical protein [Prevotella communis]UKK61481.1 hypothetical protein L6468_10870 [Prevotella communis]UKK64307.1 hypothetical protein L6473_10875 [Prevotella communis]
MWFFKKKRETEQDILIKRIKSEQIDLQGIFSDINKRGEVETLFKELSKLSHPDKFEKNPEKKEIAKDLFAQILNNRNNYTRLIELKRSVEDKLLNN